MLDKPDRDNVKLWGCGRRKPKEVMDCESSRLCKTQRAADSKEPRYYPPLSLQTEGLVRPPTSAFSPCKKPVQ